MAKRKPVIHKRVGLGARLRGKKVYRIACMWGTWLPEDRSLWKNFTCKNCRRLKPKRSK